jgi:uncharacterized membrane protein (DUF485 family)
MEQPHQIARNARYGTILLVIYVVFYGGFVILSAFDPQLMGQDVGGVTLAVVYGLGLILAAFVLAIVYMILCRDRNNDANTGADGGERL